MRRVALSLVGVAAAFAVLVLALDLGRTNGGSLVAALGIFGGVLAVGYPLLYFYCCRHRLWEPWRLAVLGGLGGGLCALPFFDGPFSFGFLLLIFLLAGMALGLLFWCGAIWRNIGLTCPREFCLPCGTVYRAALNILQRGGSAQSK